MRSTSVESFAGGSRAPVDPEVLVALARACRGQVEAGFDYPSGDALRRRRVEPYRLVSSDRRWYLLAFDLDRCDWRSFRLDRMSAVTARTWHFRPRPAPDAAPYVQAGVASRVCPRSARFLVHAPAAAVRARVPPSAAVVRERSDSNCEMESGAADFVEAVLDRRAEMDEPDRSAAGPMAGRAVLVTGASRRTAIGAAIARRSAAAGASVLVHSCEQHDAGQPWGADPGGAEALVQRLRATGARAEHVSADLADPDAPARLVQTARQAFGHLDVVVANHARSSMQTPEELTAAEIDLSYAVNTRASLLLTQALAAQHDGRPGGRVVLFTSGQYHGAMPDELPHIASKAALHGLTPSLAAHLMPRGITVNGVAPGPNDTGYADKATRTAVSARDPGERWSTPADTAKLVAWLLSDEADWGTGQTIASDGGWSSPRLRAATGHPAMALSRCRRRTAGRPCRCRSAARRPAGVRQVAPAALRRR